jgi:1-acyl-sn-glycerol-3-phosphate acyltransferase
MGSGSVIFSVIAWTGGVVSTVLWGTLSVFGSLFSKTGRFQHFCMRTWSRWCCWSSRTKVFVEGRENVLRHQPQIFAANHQAIYDILILGGWIPEQFRWMARKEWYRTPFMGWHLKRYGTITIDRSNPRASAKTLLEAADCIRAGTNIVFFPEGTRQPDALLQKFKPGGFLLAMRSGVPIVPVSIIGTKEIIRKNSWRVHKGTIKLIIGKPIETSAYKKNERNKLMTDVRAAIASALPEEYLVSYRKDQSASESSAQDLRE